MDSKQELDAIVKMADLDKEVREKGGVIDQDDPVINALIRALVERAQYLDEVGLDYLIFKLKTLYVARDELDEVKEEIKDEISSEMGDRFLPITGGTMQGNLVLGEDAQLQKGDSLYPLIKLNGTLKAPDETGLIDLGNLSTGLTFQVVDDLPVKGENGIIYLKPSSGYPQNQYEEYLWIESENLYEMLGSVDAGSVSGEYLKLKGGNMIGGILMQTDVSTGYKPGISFGRLGSSKTASIRGDEGNLSITNPSGEGDFEIIWHKVPILYPIAGSSMVEGYLITQIKLNGVSYSANVNGVLDLGSISASGDYLPITGGTLTGDLRIKGAGNYGTKINLGDGDYVHISEPTDDNMEIQAKNITLRTTATNTSPIVLFSSGSSVYMPLSFQLNGTSYTASSSGIVNFGTISGSGNYLPLTGGILTGQLTISTGSTQSTLQIGASSTSSERRSSIHLQGSSSSGVTHNWQITNTGVNLYFINTATHLSPYVQHRESSSNATTAVHPIVVGINTGGATNRAGSDGVVYTYQGKGASPGYSKDLTNVTGAVAVQIYLEKTSGSTTSSNLHSAYPSASTGCVALVFNPAGTRYSIWVKTATSTWTKQS